MTTPPGFWPAKELPGSPLDYLIPIENAEDIPFPEGRFLFELWQSKKNGRNLPDRNQFKPEDMEELLPNLIFAKVIRDPLSFRLHLVGTEIVNSMRLDTMGAKMEDIRGLNDALVRYRWLLRFRQPYFCPSLPLNGNFDRYASFSSVTLPLATDGETIDWILTYLNLENQEEAAAE